MNLKEDISLLLLPFSSDNAEIIMQAARLIVPHRKLRRVKTETMSQVLFDTYSVFYNASLYHSSQNLL